jgi:hypothetical protein
MSRIAEERTATRCAEIAMAHVEHGEFVHGGRYECADRIVEEIEQEFKLQAGAVAAAVQDAALPKAPAAAPVSNGPPRVNDGPLRGIRGRELSSKPGPRRESGDGR